VASAVVVSSSTVAAASAPCELLAL
jgi:hypothetical protein